jgi:hypothetical protein
MSNLCRPSAIDTLSSGDQFYIWSTANGDQRTISTATLLTFLNSNLSMGDNKVTQYAAPSATGFSVSINDSSNSVWLVLTPVAGYAAGTLILPAVANCVDRQEILVNSTQAVTTLTITPNGSTVTGAPTTLAANGFFRLRFEIVTKTWYRVA